MAGAFAASLMNLTSLDSSSEKSLMDSASRHTQRERVRKRGHHQCDQKKIAKCL